MSVASSCCKLLPVESSYEPKGTILKIGDLEVYETADKEPKILLINIYDIFGFHNVTKQFADKLASAGFRVAIPDFFRGKPFPLEKFPPKDFKELMDFLAENVDFEKRVKPDIEAVLNHYKTQGITTFGIYGQCWGTRIATDASLSFPDFQAIGFLHPSFWKIEDASLISKPLILIPTKDEDDMVPFYNVLKERLGEDKVEHHRFDDIHHGFSAARGDLENELNRKRVDQALELLAHFFKKHVKA
jgi:dienelactone hydrolase